MKWMINQEKHHPALFLRRPLRPIYQSNGCEKLVKEALDDLCEDEMRKFPTEDERESSQTTTNWLIVVVGRRVYNTGQPKPLIGSNERRLPNDGNGVAHFELVEKWLRTSIELCCWELSWSDQVQSTVLNMIHCKTDQWRPRVQRITWLILCLL